MMLPLKPLANPPHIPATIKPTLNLGPSRSQIPLPTSCINLFLSYIYIILILSPHTYTHITIQSPTHIWFIYIPQSHCTRNPSRLTSIIFEHRYLNPEESRNNALRPPLNPLPLHPRKRHPRPNRESNPHNRRFVLFPSLSSHLPPPHTLPGNSGLGYQTLLTLAPHNPTRIYLCARSPSSASAAISSIETRVPQIAGRITFLQLDLADLDSVVSCARGFLDYERKIEGVGKERLDLLMLNAGIMAVPEGVTRQGYEVQFGVNHLGHFLLAKLLLPTLLSTAQSTSLAGSASDVRIVVLSSIGHLLAPLRSGIDFTSLKTDCGGWFSLVRYGQSKLANLLFVKELERRYGKTGITSVAVHPGLIDTNLDASCRKWPYGLGTILNLVRPVFYRSVEEGVKVCPLAFVISSLCLLS
jgi:retinol dehydrogenase-12